MYLWNVLCERTVRVSNFVNVRFGVVPQVDKMRRMLDVRTVEVLEDQRHDEQSCDYHTEDDHPQMVAPPSPVFRWVILTFLIADDPDDLGYRDSGLGAGLAACGKHTTKPDIGSRGAPRADRVAGQQFAQA